MPVKFLAVAAVLMLASVPAMAAPVLSGGDGTVVAGLAHAEPGAFGPYLVIERPGSAMPVAGYVAFGDRHGFPDFYRLDGHRVAIHGVVSMYGMPLIQMTDPDQLAVID